MLRNFIKDPGTVCFIVPYAVPRFVHKVLFLLQYCRETNFHWNLDMYCLVYEVSQSSKANIQQRPRYFQTLLSDSSMLRAGSFCSSYVYSNGGKNSSSFSSHLIQCHFCMSTGRISLIDHILNQIKLASSGRE